MDFSPTDNALGRLIESYEGNTIRIGGQCYRPGLVVSPKRLIVPWGPPCLAGLTTGHLDELIALAPQVLLLATGARQRFPSAALYRHLLHQGIGMEVMDLGAACRTYNFLLGEGREVVAAFLPESAGMHEPTETGAATSDP